MAVGYFMGRRGWAGENEKRFLNRFILNIAVPCNCVEGMLDNLKREELFRAWRLLLAAFLSVGLCLLLASLLARLLNIPRERRGVFTAMTGLSNTIFIGIPVCLQLFGEKCMPYLMLYFLANTTFVQLAGIPLVAGSGNLGRRAPGAAGVLRALITSPPVLGVIAGIALLLLGLRLPAPIMQTVRYIGGSVTPLALIYCGLIIYELGLRNVHFQRGMPTMLLVRLVAAPLICLFCCRLLGITGLARDVFVVESGLPVVTQIVVMAGAYGADEKYAAAGLCLSTLGSFISIPVLSFLLQ